MRKIGKSARLVFCFKPSNPFAIDWKLQILLKKHIPKLQKEKERFFVDFSIKSSYNEQKYIKELTMTDELRQCANALHKQITDLTAQIQIIEEMHHCDNSIQIRCSQVGEITIPGGDELKDDIIDVILGRLNSRKEGVEDDYRRL